MLWQRGNSVHVLYIGALLLTFCYFFYQEHLQRERIGHGWKTISELRNALDTTERTVASLRSASHEAPQSLFQEPSTPEVEDTSSIQSHGQSESPSAPSDLILYSFYETDEAIKNFRFFLVHALHAKADFIIMLNGEHTQDLSAIESLPNVRVVQRENNCFDLGGYYEILQADPTLVTKYNRFMFINASLRGPFFPPWAEKICWSDAYWDKLDEKTRIVGMTWNCANGIPHAAHIQSMVLALSRQTLQELMLPHMHCYEDMHDAVINGETMIAERIMAAGYDVFAMESRFTAHAGPTRKNATEFLGWCVDSEESAGRGGNDVLNTGNYEGTTLHPYETIFAKTNRNWDERDRRAIDLLTEHADLEGYSSYDVCK